MRWLLFFVFLGAFTAIGCLACIVTTGSGMKARIGTQDFTLLFYVLGARDLVSVVPYGP